MYVITEILNGLKQVCRLQKNVFTRHPLAVTAMVLVITVGLIFLFATKLSIILGYSLIFATLIWLFTNLDEIGKSE